MTTALILGLSALGLFSFAGCSILLAWVAASLVGRLFRR